MARLLFMTDFSESYANKLLQGIIQYTRDHTPWVVCKMPLSLRDNDRMDEVVRFAAAWKADAIIGQFRPQDDLEAFRRHGIIPLCQDFRQRFPGFINISGDYALSGKLAADYFIEKRVRNFAFFGLKGMVWSDGRRDGFLAEILARVPDASFSLLERRDLDATWWYDQSQLIDWLRSLPKPVGIFACDDNRAYYIIEAGKQGGEGVRIPDDIMVLGVDNDETVCQLCDPQLSSLNQDTVEAGYRVARLIDRLLALPPQERMGQVEDIIVRPTFVAARRSTDAFLHNNPYISKIMYYINANLSSHLGVSDIVSQVPMSRRLLESTFRREVGMSVYQYILHARVEKMKDLMVNGYTPLQAANELDIDYKILARSFKKLVGMSPSAFAREQTAMMRLRESPYA